MADKKKQWTVMVYLAGDNNLSEECVYALKELKRVGTRREDGCFDEEEERGPNETEQVAANRRRAGRKENPRTVNVVAQFDPSGRANMTRRFHIGDADDDGVIEADVVAVLEDETDTGAHKYLLDFLIFCIEEFPADYYMVVLAGHGGGTNEDFFLRDEGRPFSLLPSALSIPDLQEVFKEKNTDGTDSALKKALKDARRGERIDILGFDTCVMSMAEVCYQLRKSQPTGSLVDLMIGSEGFTPTAGWPYHRVLRVLRNKPDIEPEPLARKIVERYTRFYVNYELGGLAVDQSVLRVKNIENLAKKVKYLTATLSEKLREEYRKLLNDDGTRNRVEGYEFPRPRFIDAIIMAHWEAQSYNGEQFIDLFDFCNILRLRYSEKWYNKKCEFNLHEADEDERDWAGRVNATCEGVMRAIGGPSNFKFNELDGEEIQANDAVVLASCYNGPTFQYSYGVSIYFPWSCTEFANHYFHAPDDRAIQQGRVPPHGHLDFPRDSGWGEFLQLYFKATVLRPPRNDSPEVIIGNVRSGPPATKGPNAPVHSMRNPPLYFIRPKCAERERDRDEQQQQQEQQQQDETKS